MLLAQLVINLSITVGSVAIFQIWQAKLLIFCSCSRYYIFQIVLLELILRLVIRGKLNTVEKLPPEGFWRDEGCLETSDRPKVIGSQAQVKKNLLHRCLRKVYRATLPLNLKELWQGELNFLGCILWTCFTPYCFKLCSRHLLL